MKTMRTILMITLFAGITWGQSATKSAKVGNAKNALKQPVEIGTVHWQRDFDASLATSKATGKPVFVLFQEVPGCAGCQKFGRQVLSNPLLVEAIENEFVPVVVFNNRSSGDDPKLLKRYNEPSWNYQVVRFLDHSGKDIIPRKDRIWSTPSLATRMIATLQSKNRSVPKYLHTLAESDSAKHDTAAFAMHCFWTGEYELGKIDGVVATEAGWLDGREVTLVKYNAKKLSLKNLAMQAQQVKCADKMYTANGTQIGRLTAGKLDKSYRAAKATDQKRQLARWDQIHKIPNVNAMQLTKINALAPRNMNKALQWLSPNQLKHFRQMVAR